MERNSNKQLKKNWKQFALTFKMFVKKDIVKKKIFYLFLSGFKREKIKKVTLKL